MPSVYMGSDYDPVECPDTDDAEPDVVLRELARCAAHWEPQARIVGNVRAGDILRAVNAALTSLPPKEKQKP